MKHVYSGNDLRSRGTMPAGGPPPQSPPRPDNNPSGPVTRGVLMVGIAILLVLVVGFALVGVWVRGGGQTESDPVPQPAPNPPGFDINPTNQLPSPPPPRALLEEYLRTSPLQVRQMFEYVKNSEHVQGNSLYRDSMGRVQFLYDENDDTVNAYATAHEKGPGRQDFAQEIRCYAGAARFARLISLALAAELEGREGAVQALLGAMSPEQFGTLTLKDAIDLANTTGLDTCLTNAAVRTEAESIAAGMLQTVLAHESGHHALGHVFGSAATLEISRNQEREADTFASSVISSSGFGKYMFEGMLFWHCALVSQQEGARGEGTHPLARERLANLIQQNPEKAAAWGITQGL